VEAVKEMFGLAPLHIVAVFAVVTEGFGFTVTVINSLFVTHDVSVLLFTTTLTLSPLFTSLVVKVCPAAFEIFSPLICHWYRGLTPPVRLAVKVIESSAQIVVPEFAVTSTEVGHCP
ncbi:MAG: hypothetical protein WBL21_05470, partial [Salinimicrobium sp.]